MTKCSPNTTEATGISKLSVRMEEIRLE